MILFHENKKGADQAAHTCSLICTFGIYPLKVIKYCSCYMQNVNRADLLALRFIFIMPAQ